MIQPRSIDQPVQATKDGSSTILAPTSEPYVVADGEVHIEKAPLAPKQVLFPTGGGKITVDKDTIMTAWGQGSAFEDAFSDLPSSSRLWEPSGLVHGR